MGQYLIELAMVQGGSVFLLDSNNPLWAATRKSSRAKDPQKPGATLNVALFQRFPPHNNKFLSTNRPKMEPHSKVMRVRSDTFGDPLFQSLAKLSIHPIIGEVGYFA